MNSFKNITAQEYNSLYEMYLESPRPSKLLVAPSPAIPFGKDTHLLDLCSGTGAVVKDAIRLGVPPENIIAVEEAVGMTMAIPKGVTVYPVPIRIIYANNAPPVDTDFDIITCRGSIYYWWNVETLEMILKQLKPGGCFVFDTIGVEYPFEPQPLRYKFNGRHHIEIAYRHGNTLHHVLTAEGLPPHTHSIKLIPKTQREDENPAGHTYIYTLRAKE